MNDIIDLHNYFRSQKGLPLLTKCDILTEVAIRNSKWMARRGWNNYWNWGKSKTQLLGLFEDVDYNIGVGDNEHVVMKHFFKIQSKTDKIYGNFTSIGYGVFETQYKHWCVIYGR
jgi:hypothetical protein